MIRSRASRHSPLATRCVALLVAATACSGSTTTDSDALRPADAASSVAAPPPAAIAPELPDVSESDRDGDRIDDAFATLSGVVNVEAVLNEPTQQRHLAAFVAAGGHVRHVFEQVSYGWLGSIELEQLAPLRDQLGDALRLLAAPKQTELHLDEATRTGRVRPVWAPGFAGSNTGFSGNANITIGIVDSGVDASHVDLSGRMVGWRDYTIENATPGTDAGGHGTHVASIALGSGAAFGVGPNTLRYTNSGTLMGLPAGAYLPGAIHTPNYFGATGPFSATAKAVFVGSVPTTLYESASNDPNGAWTPFTMSMGLGQLANAGSPAESRARYTDSLRQSNPPSVTSFAVANTIPSYPAVGDGFNVLSGVAPKCQWYGAKVFSQIGGGTTADISAALDDMVAQRVTKNIKVINLSLGVSTGTDTVLRAKLNTVVDFGIVVVASGGNGGPTGTITDPGRAGKVLTLAASNDKNELTSYSSIGFDTIDASTDQKPDLLAPGGSSYRSLMMAADSNTSDAKSSTFPDLAGNDYAVLQGTSMAAPFAAGAAALVIDALQQSGVTWSASSNVQPLFVKMLLLASATETNAAREQGTGKDPTLGRANALKDPYEGYGLLNVDAAVEAVSLPLASAWSGNASSTPPARIEWERRAWGRKAALDGGANLALALSVPSTADFDVYLYSGNAGVNGSPVLLASSTNAGVDTDESLSFTASGPETAYVFVKRVSGYGAFSASSKCTSNTGLACAPKAAPSSVGGAGGGSGAGSGAGSGGANGNGGSGGISGVGGVGGSSGEAPRNGDGGTFADEDVAGAAGEFGVGGNGDVGDGDGIADRAGAGGDAGALDLANAGGSAGEAGAPALPVSEGPGKRGILAEVNQDPGCGCRAAPVSPPASRSLWLVGALLIGAARSLDRKGQRVRRRV